MSRHTLRFVLNGKLHEVSACAPDLTVLQYLREQCRLTGTKEGCAEGDCGACTAVLVEAKDGALHYQAVNTCILFLPVLDGRELITVEHIGDPASGLHPVQQAMVEQHGSQCGFCTPGFVMSLFAMYHSGSGAPVSRREIDTGLAGNLCRCTGYAPIVRAAQASLPGGEDSFTKDDPDRLARLNELNGDEMLAMEAGSRRYYAPTRLEELCTLLDTHPGATLFAGATDVGLWVTKQLEAPETLIYTGKVQELLQLELDSGQRNLVIGGAVTYSKAEPLLTRHFTGWDEMLNRLGAVQVRNAGTIGGNIANGSPIGDMPPGLIALDARLVLASKSGEREIALEDFFIRYGEQDLRPGECVARIVLPLPSAGLQFRTYKLSKRIEQDISAVSAAFSIALNAGRISEARVCYGGLAETPRRAAGCEKELQGSAWDSATLDRAMQALGDDFQPITDMRASSQYRLDAARNLLRRFFFETTGADYPVRLSSRYPDLGEPA